MKLNSFRVVPALPERLAGLREIAYNLRWSWDDDLRTVFSRLDRDLWDRTYQNPVLLLGSVSQERLEALSRDDSYLALYDRALERLRAYLNEPTAWDRRWPDRPLVAYFSAEYGIAECLPVLPECCLISLDHDLNPMPRVSQDPGTGLEVAELLARQQSVCPVILHTSNAERRWSMHNEFRFGHWSVEIVPPIGDDWIPGSWLSRARALIGV